MWKITQLNDRYHKQFRENIQQQDCKETEHWKISLETKLYELISLFHIIISSNESMSQPEQSG